MPKKKTNSIAGADIQLETAADVMNFVQTTLGKRKRKLSMSVELLDAQERYAEWLEHLNAKQRMFHFNLDIQGMNATAAAKAAGFGENSGNRLNNSNDIRGCRKAFIKVMALQYGIAASFVRHGLVNAYLAVSDPKSEHFSGASTAAIAKVINIQEGHNEEKSTVEKVGHTIVVHTGVPQFTGVKVDPKPLEIDSSSHGSDARYDD